MLSYKDIQKIFSEKKCAVISVEPLDIDNIQFICCCGNEEYLSLGEFQAVGHCGNCNGWNKAIKNTYEYVKQYFDIHGCQLVSTEYFRLDDKLEYICGCGELINVTFNNYFQSKTKSCTDCANLEKNKLTYEFVFNEFKKRGFQLLSTEYMSCSSYLEYICSCSNSSKITYNEFRQGGSCKDCGIRKNRELRKHPFDEVYKYFLDNGCKLLSAEYTNNKQLLKYICICGEESQISFKHFKNGSRCGCVKSKGEELLITYLKKMKISYDLQKKFDDCKRTNKLRFDIFVPSTNNIHQFLIEFDGVQHFKPKSQFGGEKGYKSCVESDNIKNKYCIDNDIPLLRISHKEINDIEFILKLYISMVKNLSAPPILFTNRTLYKPMKDALSISNSCFIGMQ